LLQYTSYNVIELTEIGVNFIAKKEEKKKEENEPASKETS
jgi:hypothetical protein